MSESIGISAIATELPRCRVTVDELAAQHRLDPKRVRDVGVLEKRVAIGDDEHHSDLALGALPLLLTGAGPAVAGET